MCSVSGCLAEGHFITAQQLPPTATHAIWCSGCWVQQWSSGLSSCAAFGCVLLKCALESMCLWGPGGRRGGGCTYVRG
jgi:hypothetical protein